MYTLRAALLPALALGVALLPAPASAATISVNTFRDELNSDGDCSLREAVEAANTNAAVDGCPAGEPGYDLIGVDEALPEGRFHLTLGELVLAEAVELNCYALSLVSHTLTAEYASRIFRIAPGVGPVMIQGFRISRGTAEYGGAILVEAGADVTLYNNVISYSEATGYGGGGLYNNGGTVTIGRTVFKFCFASGDNGAGGTIFNDRGTLTASVVTLTTSEARTAGGGIANFGGDVVLQEVTLSENNAGTSDGYEGPGLGGGLHSYGGSVTISQSTIYDNTALVGGGLWSGGALHVTTTTIRENVASGDSTSRGGGLYHAGGVTTLEDVTFMQNAAPDASGGGLYVAAGRLTAVRTTLSGNTADEGGGLHVARATATLANTTVAENVAAKRGGGVLNTDGTLSVANTVIGSNAIAALAVAAPSYASRAIAPPSPDCAGIVDPADFSVLGESSGCAFMNAAGSSITGQDPMLGPLALNGGPMLTHAPQPGSPAIDLGGVCGPADQRGLPAPAGAACDAGAIESGASASPVVVALVPESAPVVIPASGGEFRFDATYTNRGDQPLSFHSWTAAIFPDSSQHAMLLPVTVHLGPGEQLTMALEQHIPASAPAGAYTYLGFVGRYPQGVIASSQFSFVKEAAVGSQPAPSDDLAPWAVVYAETGAPVAVGDVWTAAPEAASAVPKGELSAAFALHAAAPNPFAAQTTLRYDVPAASHVRVTVHDVLGREVARLVDGEVAAGRHAVVLDGRHLPSGTYLVRLEARGAAGLFAQTQRVTVLR